MLHVPVRPYYRHGRAHSDYVACTDHSTAVLYQVALMIVQPYYDQVSEYNDHFARTDDSMVVL
jgi:hypothetical protein